MRDDEWRRRKGNTIVTLFVEGKEGGCDAYEFGSLESFRGLSAMLKERNDVDNLSNNM